MNAEIDVRNVLPLVRVPTLVIHRSGDLCLKVEEGRYVAEKIPGSRYVELGGADHLPFVGDQNEILDEIESFVTGIHGASSFDRVLATVMNVQIGNGRVGPDVLEAALASVRKQVEMFKGNEIASDNGNVIAAFDGPARAIRCALSIERMVDHGLEPRIGIHTGECDRVGDAYSGFAVDLAERIADKAAAGTILVSRTVKDLVAGSGIAFDEYGIESFDGLDGEWRLFVVRR
jgi:class 3 adenylate cyclase